jgi:putative oxidoreductase
MVGGVFLSEGILKFTYVNQGVGRFTKIGIPFPQQTATFIGVLEIVGGLMLIAGLFTRRDLVAGRSPPAPSPAPSC